MEKMSNAERARQFMPFAALRGFEEMIREQAREVTPKNELSEYDAARLSRRMSRVKKGSMVRVRYYEGDAYVTREGMVAEIDLTMRRMRLIKTEIHFDDIAEIAFSEEL